MLADYPKWIPNPTGAPAEIIVKNAAEHAQRNPEDYAKSLEEKEAKANAPTVDSMIAAAVEAERAAQSDNIATAVAEERERCAKIADTVGGKTGQSIAALIRQMVPADQAPQGEQNQGSEQPQS